LRADALRQCFFDIARPSLALLDVFWRQSTVKSLSRLRAAAWKTRPKSAALRSRLSLLNRLLDLLVNPGLLLVVVTGAGRLRRQPSAAFGAAALQDKTAGLGRHAGTETVRACALDFAGLVCAFHGLSRDPFSRAIVGSEKRPVRGRIRRRAARVRRWSDSVNRLM
jgi:hypothetical protein